jgi:hypothetical protein
VENIYSSLEKAVEALERVRALHKGNLGGTYCFECDMEFPCDTSRALDGDKYDKTPQKFFCEECGCDENHYEAIERVREILKGWAPDISSTTEQSYYDQIVKALVVVNEQ